MTLTSEPVSTVTVAPAVVGPSAMTAGPSMVCSTAWAAASDGSGVVGVEHDGLFANAVRGGRTDAVDHEAATTESRARRPVPRLAMPDPSTTETVKDEPARAGACRPSC